MRPTPAKPLDVTKFDDEIEIVVRAALRFEHRVHGPSAVEPGGHSRRVEPFEHASDIRCAHLVARDSPGPALSVLRAIVAEMHSTAPTLTQMRAYRTMQLAKNGLYRATGEAVKGIGALDGAANRSLRVLMYHKVNDLSPNPITVPTAVFAEQMALLDTLGYVPVSLAAVRDYYVGGTPLPERAVLITFDDGYRDNLVNALPILRERGYPAVIFAPIGYLDDSRPLPHEEALLGYGVHNPTLDWAELAELEAGGVRIEAHGIGHRQLVELGPADALREIALSKLRLEERLGRELDAYAYVKGSRADYRAEHASLVQQAGYKLAFTAVSGANGPGSDRFQLLRYNIEPYSARAFELVLEGACDVLSVKDTVVGTHARRAVTRALGMASR